MAVHYRPFAGKNPVAMTTGRAPRLPPSRPAPGFRRDEIGNVHFDHMSTTLANLPPRYRDGRRLAVGGMGELYRATDSELGRLVVLKILSERYARDAGLRARFEREALAAARLSGAPNVVTIFDVTEHGGRPIIVMEYLAGGSLAEAVAGRPVPPARALGWLEEAAAGIDAAHAVGVVHRDVKPANMLLDEQGHVHVADFGVASALGMDSLTQTGTIIGTAGYLSPEQAVGEHATAASDRYALAVVAWELLVGRRPFAGESATAEALAHVKAPVPSATDANPGLPREVDRVLARGLAKEPDARYPSAAEFVGDLRRAFEDAAGDTVWFTPPPSAGKAPSQRRWWIPALVALLLLAGVVAGVLATRGSGDHAAPPPRTVVRTVTAPGRTVQETVTTAADQPSNPPSGAGGGELNNEGYAKMQAGDFAGALPLLEQAVQKLDGTGALDEAYAKYNLAYTRFALGRCTDVTSLLDQAQQIEGHRVEIDQLRKRAEKKC
jgi:eukaryotic-like serine/threonine-protein kinase